MKTRTFAFDVFYDFDETFDDAIIAFDMCDAMRRLMHLLHACDCDENVVDFDTFVYQFERVNVNTLRYNDVNEIEISTFTFFRNMQKSNA